MRMLMTVLVLCCSSFAAERPTTVPLTPEMAPTTRPVRMSAELRGAVSVGKDVPLKVDLFFAKDEERAYANNAFQFLLLDENGKQVGARYATLISDAAIRRVEMNGREPSYEPRLLLGRQTKGLVVGRKYQLVCFLPSAGLAHGVWFTLAE